MPGRGQLAKLFVPRVLVRGSPEKEDVPVLRLVKFPLPEQKVLLGFPVDWVKPSHLAGAGAGGGGQGGQRVSLSLLSEMFISSRNIPRDTS